MRIVSDFREPILGNIPLLDNKETSGRFWPKSKKRPTAGRTRRRKCACEHEKRARHNGNRSVLLKELKKQNSKNVQGLKTWLRQQEESGQAPSKDVRMAMYRMSEDWKLCCRNSLFREHLSNGTLELIAPMRCKNRFCTVCNAASSKDIRSKLYQFFGKNKDLLKTKDFCHLTLTVPHSKDGGYKGETFYLSPLLSLFNQLRRMKAWKDFVYAGESGVEITMGEKGLHIHIHALLLLNKSKRNRNKLHKAILLRWNKLTAGATQATSLPIAFASGLVKANSSISSKDIAKLDPSGATMIGLESLYVIPKNAASSRKGEASRHRQKRYVRPEDGFDSMMAGIMETVKYHFEPTAMYQDGSIDYDLLSSIVLDLKNKRMHQKFGAFYAGSKNAHPDCGMLRMSANKDLTKEELKKEVQEIARDQIRNPETGEEAEREEYTYVIGRLTDVTIRGTEKRIIRFKKGTEQRRFYLHSCRTMFDALNGLQEVSLQGRLRKQRLIRNYQDFIHRQNNIVTCLN
jgi:hypothetical protein